MNNANWGTVADLHEKARMSAGHIGAGQHRHDCVMLGGRTCLSLVKGQGPQVYARVLVTK